MRFLLVEDHPIFRFGLRQLILQRWPQAVFADAESVEKALQEIRQCEWDIAIVDLNLPDAQGLEGLSRIRRASAGLRILVLSLHEEAVYARQALQLGAQGYLTKENAPDELVLAIDKVLAGGRYLSQNIAQSLALGEGRDGGEDAMESLGSQEYRVMLQLIAGVRVSEIALQMNLSPKTVSTYRTRLFEKLGVGSNVELALYCRQRGITGELP
ncbi:DNA-binding response regulator [Rhodoferax lacus]|uniref:DNA-binding response regulator n=1 Tax=Rhodoferax lacus TaxID=2184758 RepID=A0A3E1REN7_9BURK|nr:response regulator transcription factor [Rhodoferax lacus]RFO97829.1 DNA-binding response regulator [Rhodoferax lacus]